MSDADPTERRQYWFAAAALGCAVIAVTVTLTVDRSPADPAGATNTGESASDNLPLDSSTTASPATTSAAGHSTPTDERPRFTGPLTVSVLGDSLALSARSQLIEAMSRHTVTVDAAQGRTISQATPSAAELVELSEIPDVVVVALGTNNWATGAEDAADDIEALLSTLESVTCVVWIDAQEFRAGLKPVNEAIEAAMRGRDGGVGYWSNIAGPAVLHREDGYHLSEPGMVAFASLIEASVEVFC